MLDGREYRELHEDLASSDVTLKAAALREIARNPTGDRRVVALLKECLDDMTPCVVSLPYLFGEMRYLAAQALKAEGARSGRTDHGVVEVIKPLTVAELSALEPRGVGHKGGIEGALEGFAVLRDKRVLPTIRIAF